MIKSAALMLIAAPMFGYAQGTVNFNNRVTTASPAIDAPISYAAVTGLGGSGGTKIDGSVRPTARAGLYAGPDDPPEDQLVLVGPAVNFRSGSFAGYVNVGASTTRTIPGAPAE